MLNQTMSCSDCVIHLISINRNDFICVSKNTTSGATWRTTNKSLLQPFWGISIIIVPTQGQSQDDWQSSKIVCRKLFNHIQWCFRCHTERVLDCIEFVIQFAQFNGLWFKISWHEDGARVDCWADQAAVMASNRPGWILLDVCSLVVRTQLEIDELHISPPFMFTTV